MADIGKTQLIHQSLAQIRGPVAGAAIEHDRGIAIGDHRHEFLLKLWVKLARFCKCCDQLGPFDNTRLRPFLGAANIDDQRAVFLSLLQILIAGLL